VYGLFDTDLSNSDAIGILALKSFIIALVTGLVLGILNVFFKVKKVRGKE
jgi:hypothetical protein